MNSLLRKKLALSVSFTTPSYIIIYNYCSILLWSSGSTYRTRTSGDSGSNPAFSVIFFFFFFCLFHYYFSFLYFIPFIYHDYNYFFLYAFLIMIFPLLVSGVAGSGDCAG